MTFTILGPPRTKKTSNRIVQIKGKDGGRGFTKILPSEAFEEWLKAVLLQGASIRAHLARAGATLPLVGLVNVRATFYRDRESGDATGYYQALADALQTRKERIDEKTKRPKVVRDGLGILEDDVQIVSWDGSRLRKDATRPRIEVEIESVGDGQGGLF